MPMSLNQSRSNVGPISSWLGEPRCISIFVLVIALIMVGGHAAPSARTSNSSAFQQQWTSAILVRSGDNGCHCRDCTGSCAPGQHCCDGGITCSIQAAISNEP